MSAKLLSEVDNPVEQISKIASNDELEAMTRSLTFMDALRIGSKVTNQEYNWGSGNQACALSAARIGAQATGWVRK